MKYFWKTHGKERTRGSDSPAIMIVKYMHNLEIKKNYISTLKKLACGLGL